MSEVPSDAEQGAAWARIRASLRRIAAESSRVAFLLGTSTGEADVGLVNLYDPDAEAFITEYEYRAIQSLTIRGAALTRDVLLDAVRRGLGNDDIAAALEAALEGRVATVEAIGRTESNRAANHGRLSAWRKSGVVQRKEYLATLDDRVRPGHLEAHGEVEAMDAPFQRGDAAGYLMPPVGVNCRCTAAPVTSFTDPQDIQDDQDAGEAHAEDLALASHRPRDPIAGLIGAEDRHAARLVAAWRDGIAILKRSLTQVHR